MLKICDILSIDFSFVVYQIGGGSLRIYKREVQERVLEIVGISPKMVSLSNL